MAISKKTIIISASVATLILIVGIAAFIWLRIMEIPSELNMAAKQDKQSVGMTKSPVSQTPVIRKKMPPAPPKVMETVSQAPEVKPTVTEPQTEVVKTELQTEVVKQDASKDITPTTEKLVKAEPPPPAPKTEPEPVKFVEAMPAPAPSPKEPEKVEVPEPPKAFAFTMQVGAFLVKKNADERIRILNQMGQKPYAFDSTDKKSTQWHTVRIGHYETLTEARKDLEKFKNTSPFDAVVIQKDSLSLLKKSKKTGSTPANQTKS